MNVGEGRFEPYIVVDSTTIFGDNNIARYIARNHSAAFAGTDVLSTVLVDQWLEFTLADFEPAKLDTLNEHLSLRTYLVGHELSLADLSAFVHLHRNHANPSARHAHVKRWLDVVVSQPKFASAVEQAFGTTSSSAEQDQDELCPPLEGAVDGAVVTRFPPEPSGYLHIGHCKAVLLNNYYARRYHGKLVVRFDDTNPSKEKEEFEDSIIRDLEALDVHGDIVSRTYDAFHADIVRCMHVWGQ